MEVDGQCHAPAALPPGKTATHFIGGCVRPKACLDGCVKSRFHWDSIPGQSNLYRVAISTEVSRPTKLIGKR